MNESFAPRRTDKLPVTVSLTGKLIPWKDGQAVLLSMPMSPHLYLSCFSTQEKLESILSQAEVEWDKIKEIDDGKEFIVSIINIIKNHNQDIIIIIDPYYTETGTIKFTQVKL